MRTGIWSTHYKLAFIKASSFWLYLCGTTTTLFFSVENCQEVYDTLIVLAFRHFYLPALGNLAGYAISGSQHVTLWRPQPPSRAVSPCLGILITYIPYKKQTLFVPLFLPSAPTQRLPLHLTPNNPPTWVLLHCVTLWCSLAPTCKVIYRH